MSMNSRRVQQLASVLYKLNVSVHNVIYRIQLHEMKAKKVLAIQQL